MDALGSVGTYLNPILQFLQEGFEEVNAVQGLLIALFATVLMRRWAQLFAIALGAAAFYIVVEWAVPIVTAGAPIKLPNVVDIAFWKHGATLFVGFVIIVAMFFAVKSVLFGARSQKHKAKAR